MAKLFISAPDFALMKYTSLSANLAVAASVVNKSLRASEASTDSSQASSNSTFFSPQRLALVVHFMV